MLLRRMPRNCRSYSRSGKLSRGLILTAREHDAVSPLALSDVQRPVATSTNSSPLSESTG